VSGSVESERRGWASFGFSLELCTACVPIAGGDELTGGRLKERLFTCLLSELLRPFSTLGPRPRLHSCSSDCR
jgi:hypothetical protein